MRLSNVEIIKLLPAWMRDDGAIKGLAAGTDKAVKAINARLRMLSRWDKIDELSEEELDALAWDLNILWYDSTAPIEAKRAVVKSSDLVYAKLGTKYAVEQLTADYFGSGKVSEWFDYNGKPHHFQVECDNPRLVGENLTLYLKRLDIVKRQSSWLDKIVVRLSGQMELYFGAAVRECATETVFLGVVGAVTPYCGTATYDFSHETHRIAQREV